MLPQILFYSFWFWGVVVIGGKLKWLLELNKKESINDYCNYLDSIFLPCKSGKTEPSDGSGNSTSHFNLVAYQNKDNFIFYFSLICFSGPGITVLKLRELQ